VGAEADRVQVLDAQRNAAEDADEGRLTPEVGGLPGQGRDLVGQPGGLGAVGLNRPAHGVGGALAQVTGLGHEGSRKPHQALQLVPVADQLIHPAAVLQGRLAERSVRNPSKS
jgi:hypothetical protein